MKYNLYYTLNKNIKKTPLTQKQKLILIERINKFSESEHEAFFMLIREHFILGNILDPLSGDIKNLYNCDKTEDGIKFDLESFPNDLKWVLWKFGELVSGEKNEFS